MTKIVRETVVDRTVALLRERILRGRLLPGVAVTEEALAAELGVSRPTVRQALNTLAISGLLTRHPSTRVLEVTTLTSQDIIEIYRARRFLELAGVDAAAAARPEELLRIEQAVMLMAKAVDEDDLHGFVEADSRCHAETVGLLRSRYLSHTHAELMAKLHLAISQVSAEEQDSAVMLLRHREFSKLLAAGRLREARANLEQRLIHAEQAVLPKAIAHS